MKVIRRASGAMDNVSDYRMKVMIITSLSGSLRMKHLILNKESDTGESGGRGREPVFPRTSHVPSSALEGRVYSIPFK